MKVAHICLSCFYIDNGGYQENEIIAQHVSMGKDVVVIASTENYNNSGQLVYEQPKRYLGSEGCSVIRIPYRSWFPHKVMKKLRFYKGLYNILEREKPDVIFFHGLCAGELLTVARYVARNRECKFHIDSHEDSNNSARSFISKYVLHGIFYRAIISMSFHSIHKVLCISLETMDFVNRMYGIPRDKLEFYPLGGTIFGEEDYNYFRSNIRARWNVEDCKIVFLQSGKLTPRKKIIESLKAFSQIKSQDFEFFITGVPSEEISDEFYKLVNADPRIHYLGWIDKGELKQVLCAADVYLQPGTQSVTMQQALCSRCAVVVDNVLSHGPYVKNNGWLISSPTELEQVFIEISKNKNSVSEKSRDSYLLACSMLNYSKLAKQVLGDC